MEITHTRGIIPKTVDEALTISEILAKSDLVPKDFKGKPQNVFVAINWGLEIGISPMQAVQNIAVINGRPAVWGDAALALVRGSGLLEKLEETQTETEAKCIIKRKGEKEVEYTFSRTDAERAGLWDNRASIESYGKQIKNPAPWHRYPKRMMQMRARSFALRDKFTDVLKGIGIVEEEKDKPTDDKEIPGEIVPTVEPVDALSETEEAETSAEDAVVIEEEVSETNPGITVADILKLYKGAAADMKPKILEELKEGWRESDPYQLEEYFNKITELLL